MSLLTCKTSEYFSKLAHVGCRRAMSSSSKGTAGTLAVATVDVDAGKSHETGGDLGLTASHSTLCAFHFARTLGAARSVPRRACADGRLAIQL